MKATSPRNHPADVQDVSGTNTILINTCYVLLARPMATFLGCQMSKDCTPVESGRSDVLEPWYSVSFPPGAKMTDAQSFKKSNVTLPASCMTGYQ